VEASRLPRSFERSLTLRKLTDQIRRPSHVLLCEHCITCEATLSEDSGVRYPAPTLIGCLVVKELRCRLCRSALLRCLQQRNKIMQSFLRFVNRFSNFFRCGRRCKLRCANLPVAPQPLLRLRCSAALCVARGRIVGRIRAPCNNFVTTIR